MLPTTIEDIPDDGICVYIDEVGRGSGATCVTTACVIWNNNYKPNTQEDEKLLNMIKDSKKLSAKNRDKLAIFIKENAIEYSIHCIDNEEIDRINILQATFKAMHCALDKLTIKFDRIVVDGNKFKTYMDKDGNFVPHTCVVNGDNRILGIAAASILAKVYRDNLMIDLHNSDETLQVYCWHKNKGYLTSEHMEAIKKYGLSKYHRKTFIHI
jgi:ribonuclease HII